MTITDLLERSERFNAEQAIKESIDVTSAEAVLLNLDQLLHGKTSKDGDVAPEYGSYSYAFYKFTKNNTRPFWSPDLKDTGDFYDGFFLSTAALDKGDFELDSFDGKTEKLTDRYSEDIFGLSAENAETYFGVYVIDHFALIVLRDLNLELK